VVYSAQAARDGKKTRRNAGGTGSARRQQRGKRLNRCFCGASLPRSCAILRSIQSASTLVGLFGRERGRLPSDGSNVQRSVRGKSVVHSGIGLREVRGPTFPLRLSPCDHGGGSR